MPSAMALKERISSPLEAGPSILDAHHLPPHLTPALEYTSSRLAKKALHLTLVIVRRDYQLPIAVPPHSPAFPSPTTPGSPPLTGGSTGSGRFGFASSPVVALKQLLRSASVPFGSNPPGDLSRSAMPSTPGLSTASESQSPKLRWPLSPTTPLPPPPMTPCTASSINTSDSSGPPTPNPLGLRFFCASDMPPKTEKALKSTLSKAGNKFGIGSWLTPFSSPMTQDLTNRLFQYSVVQNEVLFSSDGLTLLSLDRLYSIKSAVSSYSKSTSPLRLEDAVDELRRFVLANNGSKVSRSDLLRSYDWLSVSNSAIADLDRMYRRAYGGPERTGGISGMPLEMIPEPVIKELSLKLGDDDDDDDSITPSDTISDESIGVAMTVVQVFKPPSPRRIAPLPKIHTNFDLKSKPKSQEEDKRQNEENENEDGDRTARPTDRSTMQTWNKHFTIDQVLSADTLSPDQGATAIGPITPNAYDDISPITRGEWGFLMGDNGLKGRTVAVETC